MKESTGVSGIVIAKPKVVRAPKKRSMVRPVVASVKAVETWAADEVGSSSSWAAVLTERRSRIRQRGRYRPMSGVLAMLDYDLASRRLISSWKGQEMSDVRRIQLKFIRCLNNLSRSHYVVGCNGFMNIQRNRRPRLQRLNSAGRRGQGT